MQVLYAPLDWGLGHVTRSIPIIKKYEQQGAVISVACTKGQIKIIETYFPKAEYYLINALNIRYGFYGSSLSLITQLPRIFKHIRKNKSALKKILINYQHFDLIISDNRYGFYHKQTRSALICHQINLKLPTWLGGYEKWVNKKYHNKMLNNFDEIWVPDTSDLSLAGDLAKKPASLKPPIKYIGRTSRFQNFKLTPTCANCNIDYLFIISGPEIQRSLFESIIVTKIQKEKLYNCFIIRGLPNSSQNLPGNIQHANHLPDNEFIDTIRRSKRIICRSGYSSLLDLVTLGRSALLVPTPKQTEQEYLAKYLSEKKWFNTINQFELINCNFNTIDWYQLPDNLAGKKLV